MPTCRNEISSSTTPTCGFRNSISEFAPWMQPQALDNWLSDEIHIPPLRKHFWCWWKAWKHHDITISRFTRAKLYCYLLVMELALYMARSTKRYCSFDCPWHSTKYFIAAAFLHQHEKFIKICHTPYLGFKCYLKKNCNTRLKICRTKLEIK